MRRRPVRDDKVLTDLNGLLLEGFSLLARYTGKNTYIKDTEELALFLMDRLGKYGVNRGDSIDPFITDYAFLITGFTAAYSVTGDPALIDAAEKAGRLAVEELYSEKGYFYTTAEKREDIFVRRPDSADSQIPSGQNALLLGFSRLFLITGREEWLKFSNEIIEYQSDMFKKIPAQFGTMIQALLVRDNGYHAVAAGNPDDTDFINLKKKLLLMTSPDFPVITAEYAKGKKWQSMEGRRDIDSVQALICSNSNCLSPVKNGTELENVLSNL